MDWSEVRKKLREPLDPRAIKPPPQGKFGEYVDGLHVIREANRIFGENGWSYTVTRLEQGHRVLTKNDTQVRCSFICSILVDVDGVKREGVACGVGVGKIDNEGDVIESAVKEAETDALKRALRSFGNTFGLALYEKDKSAREVGITMSSAEKRDTFKGLILKAETPAQLDKFWGGDKAKASIATLDQAHQAELQTAYSDRMGEIAPTKEDENA